MSVLAEAGRFNSRIDADVARLYLLNEGIEAVLFDAEVNSFYGGLLIPVRLMVAVDDLEAALAGLAEAGLA